jgi:hypothetical protein
MVSGASRAISKRESACRQRRSWMIPRIIHQTWKTSDVPPAWRAHVDTWRHHHPGWEYRLWTDADNDEFVARHFPEFLRIYRAYPYSIMRADAVRYMLLLKYGGLYVDLDYECLAPLDSFLAVDRFTLGLEPGAHEQGHGYQRIPSNALMIAPAGNKVCHEILAYLTTDSRPCVDHQDVLHCTGPLMLHKVLADCDPSSFDIKEARVFSPFANDSRGLDVLRAGGDDARRLRTRLRRAGCYAVHYWANSWTSNLAGELNNPDPHHVDGYRFIHGRFFLGHDAANAGRDIAHTAAVCTADEAAIGFNTDGFIKNGYAPLSQWRSYTDPAPNEGTYLKEGVYNTLFATNIDD